jgi:hypothetical protein
MAFQVLVFDENNQGRQPLGTSSEIPIPTKGDIIYLSMGRKATVKRVEYHYDHAEIYIIV